MKCFLLLLQKLLTFTAKCIIGANNAIIPTFTAMQYPTVVRNFGVGMGNLAAGVALILVPYMWLLVIISKKKHTHTHNHINSNSEFHMNVCYHFTFFPQTYFYCLRWFFFSPPPGTHRSFATHEHNGSVRNHWCDCIDVDERCPSVSSIQMMYASVRICEFAGFGIHMYACMCG